MSCKVSSKPEQRKKWSERRILKRSKRKKNRKKQREMTLLLNFPFKMEEREERGQIGHKKVEEGRFQKAWWWWWHIKDLI